MITKRSTIVAQLQIMEKKERPHRNCMNSHMCAHTHAHTGTTVVLVRVITVSYIKLNLFFLHQKLKKLKVFFIYINN